MKKKLLSIALAAVLAFSAAACSDNCGGNNDNENGQGGGASEVRKIAVLAENGVTDYKVLVPENAGETTIYALSELQYFFEAATGAVLETAAPDTAFSETGKYISLGKTDMLSAAFTADYTDFGEDGFFIRTAGQSVFIDGNTERSVLYGVYDFTEKVLGVKFLTAERTYIPELASADLYAMNDTEIPAVPYRLFLDYDSMTNYQFLVRTRQTGEYADLDGRYGGGLKWFKGLEGETFQPTHNTLYYVTKDYYDEHEDWFYAANGVPREVHFSNAGILEDGSVDRSLTESPVLVAVENIKRFILNSDAEYFMIGQMDISDVCECAECQRQAEKYGRSGMNIRFLNAISDEISAWMEEEDIDRNVHFITFAYSWSIKAPVNAAGEPLDDTVIPRDNVIVRIAPITMHNYYSFLDENQANDTRTLIEQWSKVMKRSMVWTYHTSYGSYFTYYPTMHTWQDNLKVVTDMECEYYLMQSTYNEKNNWQSYIDYYVGTKMMWDPSLNAGDLRDEFITYYYGIIADTVREFIDNFDLRYALFFDDEFASGLMNKPNSSIQGAASLYDPELYTAGFWEHQLSLIDEMRAQVAAAGLSFGEEEFYTQEIDKLSLTPLFMMLMSYDSYYPGA